MITTYMLIAPLWLATPIAPSSPLPSPTPQVVVVTGNGRAPARAIGPQSRLMARRAAEVVALRNLTAELKLATPTTLIGFRFVSAAHHADGSVTVTVEWRISQ